MPGYEVDVGARAATTQGRKDRKANADARALHDICAGLAPEVEGGEVEYPEGCRKRPAGTQPSAASRLKASGSGGAGSSGAASIHE